MEEKEFLKLIDKTKYQVFLFQSRAMFPVCFAIHPWFVINKKGKLTKYDVKHTKNKENKKLGHLFISQKDLTKGIQITIGIRKTWKSKLIGIEEGNENSIAKEMIREIEETKTKYEYKHNYKLIGPNSNTYIQKILEKFKETKLKLPRSAIGKKYY